MQCRVISPGSQSHKEVTKAMDFQEFIMVIGQMGYGVVAFNTYVQNQENRCYIMVANKGGTGTFLKQEFRAVDLNNHLQLMIDKLGALKALHRKATSC